MNQWLWKHLLAAGMDVGDALNGCVKDFPDLSEDDQRRVIRTGLRDLLAQMAKGRKLEVTNGHPMQVSMFASVEDNGRFMRISYLQANLDQLRQMHEREASRGRRSNEKVERLAVDIALYEKHPDLETLQAVWDAEHVIYRLDEVA